ncbi:GGDEF domain-containing protein [Virgibacillus sp. YIM 98842]|uniref:GGDEF domain-containing protein n=1 Tax=Virgibacillus sp. YIM 98842 TaxID=2663533 RepID=UPI001F08AA70|nr:GGDEF domain-containing protein [Virgibacillus sp. YIM 98842]
MKKGNVNMDKGISYGLSIGLFAGPLGIFIFEFVQRFIVYFNRKITNTADPDEFLHTFYNTGSFALNNSIAFFLFTALYPAAQQIPFGFWLLMILLVIVTAMLSDTYLIIIFYITGSISSKKEAMEFIKSRSVLDMGKTAFSNGLLFLFLLEQHWEIIVALFLLNYLVSRSFLEKSKSAQHKMERDKFKQMAYTDFLTEVYNRAYMDRKMESLNASNEKIGIIVSDIDSFKEINDNYNHAVGDRVIQHYAATLQSFLKKDDYLFRSGGDEFTIFLRNRSFRECTELVEDMRAHVEASPAAVEDRHFPYSASFGLYYYKANEQADIKKAYVHADNLLLQAKSGGKNRTSFKYGMNDAPLAERFAHNRAEKTR